MFLAHGAPPLLDDPVWMSELAGWAADMPRPRQILIVSAHWQTAPMALSATRTVPLVYDFFGFPQRYYELTYAAPGAPELAADVQALMPAGEPVVNREQRGLDHGKRFGTQRKGKRGLVSGGAHLGPGSAQRAEHLLIADRPPLPFDVLSIEELVYFCFHHHLGSL